MANIVANQYEEEAKQIERRRAFAEALRQQGMQQQAPRMVGGVRQQASILDGLNQMLQAYSGRQGVEQADQATKDLQTRKQQALADYLGQMPKDQTTTTQQLVGDRPGAGEFQDVTTTKKATPDDYMKWLMQGTQIGPEATQIAQLGYQHAARAQDRADDQAWKATQAKEARDARIAELQLRLLDARTAREEKADLMREMQRLQQEGRADIVRLTAANKPQPGVTPVTVMRDGKPVVIDGRTREVLGDAPPAKGKSGGQLPSSALKLQQEELDAINTASGNAADIDALIKQIDSGSLKLGLGENLKSKARNATGFSTPESQNFATFQATLENMRNNSLRLNKGVQTEGDAQREWDALVANINDPKVVRKRLEEIKRIDQRAINLRNMNIESIRNNFGADPLDTSERQNVAPTITDSKATKVRKYNPVTGALE